MVVGQRSFHGGQLADQRVDVGLHLSHDLGRVAEVARGGTQLFDLGIAVVQIGCCVIDQHRHAGGVQTRDQIARVAGGDDQAGFLGQDGFDVRLEAGQIGGRRLGRIVAVLIHRHHLITRADGEQHLRRGW